MSFLVPPDPSRAVPQYHDIWATVPYNPNDFSSLLFRNVMYRGKGVVPTGKQNRDVSQHHENYQKRLNVALQSKIQENVEKALETLVIISCTNREFIVRASSGLLYSLAELLMATLDEKSCIPFNTKITEPSLLFVCQNEFHVALTFSNATIRMAIVKILYNLSNNPNNQAELASSVALIDALSDVIVAEETGDAVIFGMALDTLTSLSSYLVLGTHSSKMLNPLINLISQQENPELQYQALEIFNRMSLRSENEHVFADVDEKFYSVLIQLLAYPTILLADKERGDRQEIDAEIETAEPLRELALDIIHNISIYREAANARGCKVLGLIPQLISLAVLSPEQKEELSRRASMTLLNFASNAANRFVMLGHQERLVQAAFSPVPCARILLKALSRINEFDEADGQMDLT